MSNEINREINEMAKILCGVKGGCETCMFGKERCFEYEDAVNIYNAGYRKQSEGCDFCKVGNEKCGTCVKFYDYYEDGGSDRCSSEYGDEKCDYYKPVHHCSNCGARMKEYKCPKCNSTNLFTRKKDTQIGLYCKECGRWIKWLNKDEARFFETDTNDDRKWISVKDRLPEKDGEYLTCRCGDLMSVLMYSAVHKLFNVYDHQPEDFNKFAVAVDYWMLLPEAPKED